MANNIPRQGFKFAYNLYGKSEAQVLAYSAAAARGTNGEIFIGDAVALTSGYVVPFISGGNCVGIVVGIAKALDTTTSQSATAAMNAAPPYDPTNLQQRSLATADAGWVYVIPAGGNVFTCLNIAVTTIAQVGNVGISVVGTTGTAIAAADAHGIITGAAGYTGNSNMAVSTSLTTSKDVSVVGISNIFVGGTNSNGGQNDPASANAQVLVLFRTPCFAQ